MQDDALAPVQVKPTHGDAAHVLRRWTLASAMASGSQRVELGIEEHLHTILTGWVRRQHWWRHKTHAESESASLLIALAMAVRSSFPTSARSGLT
mgnify:CR=1 FL=1